ncbi:MAG: DUF1360 domain-containing protein [Candidatus Krumholzibacteria bacterium]|nr:DUF1360 domain-containing protein [Candidatus Krumholzibacteria bacterium]
MSVPGWWAVILLTLAAYRTWRAAALDDILDVPRRYLLRLGDWRQEGDAVPDTYRAAWGKFLGCAWCSGFWVALAWWAAWQATEKWTLIIAAPFAVGTLVGLLHRLDADE